MKRDKNFKIDKKLKQFIGSMTREEGAAYRKLIVEAQIYHANNKHKANDKRKTEVEE